MKKNIEEIIKNKRYVSSERSRIKAMEKEYAKKEIERKEYEKEKIKTNLIKRNPKSKFEKENPGGDYDKMIKDKIERIVRLDEKEIEEYYPGKRKDNREKRLIRSKYREKKQKIYFGKTVKKTRKWNNNMTQNQLAEESGLNRSYISGIEQGKHNPTLIQICKIANALNLYTYQLLEYNIKDLKRNNIKPEEKDLNKILGKNIKLFREKEYEKKYGIPVKK